MSRLRNALLLAGWTMVLSNSLSAQDPYTPIPPGFDFPSDNATLERFRKTENVAELRRHAWWVWAGINQEAASGGPVWETWYPADFVFRPDDLTEAVDGPRRRIRFEPPRQLKDQNQLEAAGQSVMSFVLFSQESLEHIRSNKLHLQSTLEALNSGFPAGTPLPDRKIAEFPREGVSLKLVWLVVKQTGLTPQPVWDFEPTRPDNMGNPPSTWKRQILVDPSRSAIPAGEMQDGMHVIPLSSFYYIKLDTPELVAATFGEGELNDYAVLVCMHLTTKEIDDWVWATFWWHDRPNNGPFAADRISEVPGVFRNYLLDVSYDSNTPREFDGTANACMNPWLEARFRNGMTSNCMTCHQRSTWPQVPFLPVTRGSLAPGDPFFGDKTKLDFLWSIGDRANP